LKIKDKVALNLAMLEIKRERELRALSHAINVGFNG